MDVQILQSTRLYIVQELAEMIGVACWWAHRTLALRTAGTGAVEEQDSAPAAEAMATRSA